MGRTTAEQAPVVEGAYAPLFDRGADMMVDYEMSFTQAIRAGRYDWECWRATAEFFPSNNRGVARVKLCLVNLGRDATSDEVEKHLALAMLRPANTRELLALGAFFMNLQRRFPIVALASESVTLDDGSREIMYLDGGDTSREVRVRRHAPESTWASHFWFLAVCIEGDMRDS